MKKSPNRSAVFLVQPGNMRIACNRMARREQVSLSRKTYDGETIDQMKIRRRVATEWRSTRRSREQGLMRAH